MLQVETLVVSMFATNCYLVYGKEDKEAVVIDPGAGAKTIIQTIKNLELKPKYILNTHGHVDHVGANAKLKAKFNLQVMLSEKDLHLYNNPGFGLKHVLKKQPRPDHFLQEGDVIKFGKSQLKVIETPGHTPGGVCFFAPGQLFCGDTLFSGSIGRTDLSGGSYEQLITSIKEKILILAPETIVYPGHGPLTTVGDERAHNPFLSG